MPFDLIIKGGTVVSASDTFIGDVGVAGGKVAAVGKLTEPAKKTVDARGKVVVPGGIAQNSAYSSQTVTVNCNANEKAISAGTGWSDDAADRELWVQRLTPIVTNNNVTGYRATGGNDSGNSSTFTLYVLCYVG